MAKQETEWDEIQKIWDCLEQQERGKYKVPEAVLQFRFEKLYAIAYRLAEACSLNIRMERTGTTRAKLTLRSDLFLLGNTDDKQHLWALMKNAGSVLVSMADGLVEFDFFYDLRGVE